MIETLRVAAALSVLLVTSHALAAPVTDFFTLRGTTATTLSGTGNTDDPVVGTAAATADGSRLVGYFAPVSLTNVGDSITFSFSFAFTAGTIANATDNFRYGLYDRNGENQITTNTDLNVVGNDDTDAFRGYRYGVDTNSGGSGVQGTIRERAGTDLTVDDPMANAGTTTLTPPGGTAVTLASDATYTGTMTLTLTAADEITLGGSFSGTNGANANSFSAVDASPITTTYSVVAFLIGDAINAEQVTFSNVDVTFTPIPEPASLSVLGLAAALLRRRRA